MKQLAVNIVFVLVCACAVRAQTSYEKSLGKKIASEVKKLVPYRRYVDLLLLCDSSGSVTHLGFSNALAASEALVDMMHKPAPISNGGSRVGAIEFSHPQKTGVRFRFGQYNTLSAVKGKISHLGFDNGGRRATAEALELAIKEFSRSLKNRKLLWAFTDGKSNTGSPLKAAYKLKRSGVKICVMGIGPRVNIAEIKAVASPGCYHWFRSFAAYMRVMKYAFLQSKKINLKLPSKLKP